MVSIRKLRKRALEIFLSKADKTVPMLIDYQIDDFLRGYFGLPDRPLGQAPYAGWIAVEKDKLDSKQTSKSGIESIKRHEGFRATAYRCPAGVWTIGYGHTATARPGMIISELQGLKLLEEDLEKFERAVNELVKVKINQNQFDALVSFTYNVGVTAFRNSTLLKVLNQGNYEQVKHEFARWVNAGGRRLPGLVKRRKDEARLFDGNEA